MGDIVIPILNGLGFANLGNAALSITRGVSGQILKTASTPADALSGLYDLSKQDKICLDEVFALISAAKTLHKTLSRAVLL
jgi:hypothetical protein